MRNIGIFLLTFLCFAVPCGAAMIRLTGSPPDFRLQGRDLSQVAAIDLTVTYDPAGLRVDGVESGPLLQGALFAANTAKAGQVRLGVVSPRPINGSGELALLRVSLPPGIAELPRASLRVSLRNPDGQVIPVTIEVAFDRAAPSPPASSPLSPATPAAIPEGRTSSSSRVLLGQSSSPPAAPAAPADTRADATAMEDLPVETTSSPQPAPPSDSSMPKPSPEPVSQKVTRELSIASPLKRFQDALPEIRTLDDLGRFLAPTIAGLRQEPFPALSDGETPVTLIVPWSAAEAPSYAFSEATLLSSGQAGEGSWKVTVLPKKGTMNALVCVLGESLYEIPLVIAPQMSLHDRPFRSYLQEWRGLAGDDESTVTAEEAYAVAVNLLAGEKKEVPSEAKGSPAD